MPNGGTEGQKDTETSLEEYKNMNVYEKGMKREVKYYS